MTVASEVGADGPSREEAWPELSPRAHLVVGLVLPVAISWWVLWRLSAYTVDDAYISFRYARNLARGLGLVFNEGEAIEGYTNFGWTVLLALLHKVGLDPVMATKLLGGASVTGMMALAYRLEADLRPFRVGPCLSTWLIASSAVVLGHSVFGLETGAFTCAVLGGLWLVHREEQTPERFPWSGIVFGLAGLMRPEAPLFLGISMLFQGGPALLPAVQRTLEDDEEGPPEEHRARVVFAAFTSLGVIALARLHLGPPAAAVVRGLGAVFVLALVGIVVAYAPRAMVRRQNLLRGGLFVLIVGGHILWRKSFYGTYLPNTLSAKTGDFTQQALLGLQYVEKLQTHEGLLAALAFVGIAFAVVRRSRWLLASATLVWLGTVYVVSVGGDWMTLYRFMAPFLPFAYVVIGVALRASLEHPRRFVGIGIVGLLLVVTLQRGSQLKADIKGVIGDDKRFWDQAAGNTASWFVQREERLGEQARGTIALGDIGQVAYETNYPILDLLGLVDPVISKLPGGYTRKTGPGFVARFFDVAPRYAVFVGKASCRQMTVPTSRTLYGDGRFRKRYHLAGRIRVDSGHAWCIFERRDAPGAEPEDLRALPFPGGRRGR